jgi:hypothetical protein
MKPILTLSGLFLSILLCGQEYLPNKVIVCFTQHAIESQVNLNEVFALDLRNDQIKPMFPNHQQRGFSSNLKNIYILNTPSIIDPVKFCKSEQSNQFIEWAEPYYLPELLGREDDPYISSQYYLINTKTLEAHQIQQGDTNIVIGIIDTGIDIYHEDLKDNIKYNYDDPINGVDDDYDGFVDNFRGWDLGENDNNPHVDGEHNHGVRVSGLASATTNNGIGIVGIGYKTKILPIKISRGSALSAAYEGVVYAADHGCQILNLSWGSTFPSNLNNEVINYATEYRNCLIVAAAGNDNNDISYYPASYRNVYSIAATDGTDKKWISSSTSGSSYGRNIALCAPGLNIFSTYYNNTYNVGNGTSYSSPIVAGAAGLVMAQHPEYSGKQIGELLRVSGDIIDTVTGNEPYYHLLGKRLNIVKALTSPNEVSVRIINIITEEISEDGNQYIDIQISGTNYLSQVTNTLIQLTHNSPYLSTENNTFNTGKLGTLDEFSNEGNTFRFKLDESTPDDYSLFAKFLFSDGNYTDYQYTTLTINNSAKDFNPNYIKTSATSNGRIGFSDYNNTNGNGWQYKNYGNILKSGGLAISAKNGNTISVVSSLTPNTEFEVLQKANVYDYEDYTIANAKFSVNKENAQLPVTIDYELKGYKNVEMQNTIIYSYKVKNNGTNEISNFRLGMFADFNMYYDYNYASFNEELNLIETFSLGSYIMHAAVCLLDENKAVPYAFDFSENGFEGLDITNGFTDDKIWSAMTYGRTSTKDTADVATFLSSAPFSIMPGESKTVRFALITGENKYVVSNTAEALRDKFLGMNDHLKNTNTLSVYPNPANNSITINIPENEKPKHYSIFNSNGIEIISHAKYTKQIIQTNQLYNGIYFIKIKTDKGMHCTKFLINR